MMTKRCQKLNRKVYRSSSLHDAGDRVGEKGYYVKVFAWLCEFNNLPSFTFLLSTRKVR